MLCGGQCVFNSDWLVNNMYKDWLQGVKGDKHATTPFKSKRSFLLAGIY